MANFKSMAGFTGLHRVTLVDQEPIEVNVIGADIMRWEQNEKGKSFFDGTPSLSRLCFVTWAAMKRQQMTEVTFSEFMKAFVDLEAEEDEDEDTEGDDDEEGGGVELPDPSEGDTTAW